MQNERKVRSLWQNLDEQEQVKIKEPFEKPKLRPNIHNRSLCVFFWELVVRPEKMPTTSLLTVS